MSQGGQPTALVADDHEDDRELARVLLNQCCACRVIEAEDGAEAVELARRERPDLILMDLSLPVVDGWEATRRLKAAPETRSIPVIALSAHAMEGDREQALAAGCDDYDTKPVDLERLLAKMRALLPAGAGT